MCGRWEMRVRGEMWRDRLHGARTRCVEVERAARANTAVKSSRRQSMSWAATRNDEADHPADQETIRNASLHPNGAAESWEATHVAAARSAVARASWLRELKPALSSAILALRRAKRRRLDVLVLGCGSSPLGEDVRASVGWPWPWAAPNVTSVDISEGIVQQMSARLASSHLRSGAHTYLAADARSLPLPAAQFDLVVDKGTINAMLADRGYRRAARMARRDLVLGDAQQVAAEARRLLRPGGLFVLVSGTDKRKLLGLDHANSGWRQPVELLEVDARGRVRDPAGFRARGECFRRRGGRRHGARGAVVVRILCQSLVLVDHILRLAPRLASCRPAARRCA